jgi:hypothetical protein
VKSIASIDQIVQFLPPGGSRIKENSISGSLDEASPD